MDILSLGIIQREKSVQSIMNSEILDRLTALEGSLNDGLVGKRPDGLLNFEFMDVGNIVAIATAFDRNLYVFKKEGPEASGSTYLFKSEDSGETFQKGMPISAVQDNEGVSALFVFEDGSVIVATRGGKIYRADSYTSTPTLVFELGTKLSGLSVSAYSGAGKNYVFVSGYDGTTERKDAYYSKDGGQTFTLLKEGDTYNTGNNHWHSVTYDPYSDGVWLSQGDGDNSRLYYTPDWGATWEVLLGTHPTEIYPFSDKVVFGRDKSGGEKPGIDTWMRSQTSLVLDKALDFRTDRSSFDFYPQRSNWFTSDKNCYYMLFPPHREDEEHAYIYGTADSGDSWHLIYNGSDVIHHMTGVDNNGYVYGRFHHKLYRAKDVTWN